MSVETNQAAPIDITECLQNADAFATHYWLLHRLLKHFHQRLLTLESRINVIGMVSLPHFLLAASSKSNNVAPATLYSLSTPPNSCINILYV
jgi:hypothetical protein